jgi:predicted nucleic acid-binding protein
MKNCMGVNKDSIDTNILLYFHQDHEVHRQPIAKALVEKHPTVSAQVVSEYLSEMEKKFRIEDRRIPSQNRIRPDCRSQR